MLRSWVFIIKLAILVLIAIWLANWEGRASFDLPGYGLDLWFVQFSWPSYRIDLPVGLLLLPVILIWMLAVLYVWVTRAVRRAPKSVGEAVDRRRQKRGYQALTQGMVAVAAGDADEAQRWARKADGLLNEPPLTMLLSAQAAQLGGDERAAKRYFEAMLERDEMRFLGLRGLLMQAVREGDDKAALDFARQAYALRPKTPWVLDMLFDLSERSGDLEAADQALREAARYKQLPAATAERKRAVLLTERALAARATGDREAALKLAREAHKLSPALVPAGQLTAELLVENGRAREAARLLEKCWPMQPHPALVAVYRRSLSERGQAGDGGIAMLQGLERLVAAAPTHLESRLALAEAALEAKLWGEARRYLTDAAKTADGPGASGPGTLGPGTLGPGTHAGGPSERICRLMARLEEAEHGDGLRARDWWLKAGEAAPDPAWVCGECGAVAVRWAARCGACHAFDSLSWTPPPRVEGPLVTLQHAGADAVVPARAAVSGPSQPTVAQPAAGGQGAPGSAKPGASGADAAGPGAVRELPAEAPN